MDLPEYDPDQPLYLGGEGMLGTADGYADFLRMLLNRGQLNGKRLLDEATIAEMVAPQTQLDSAWGHNGYNIWVNSGKLPYGSYGRGGLWIVGGYEGTHGWVDPEHGFVGVVMTQISNASQDANNRNDVFREAVYDQLLEERQGTDYKLYYLGGQSNMDGYGHNDELPPGYSGPHDRVMIYGGMPAGDGDEYGGVGLWQPLRPGFGLGFRTNGYDSWLSDRFGPELTFGHRIAELDPESNIAIVKYSRGGTPLHIDAQGYVPGIPKSKAATSMTSHCARFARRRQCTTSMAMVIRTASYRRGSSGCRARPTPSTVPRPPLCMRTTCAA